MATFTTASIKRGGQHKENMKEVIADQNYFFDAEGKVTTDEPKGERWLARKGDNVLEEHREALEAFQSGMPDAKSGGKVAQEAKAQKPASNKAEKPADNKGVK